MASVQSPYAYRHMQHAQFRLVDKCKVPEHIDNDPCLTMQHFHDRLQGLKSLLQNHSCQATTAAWTTQRQFSPPGLSRQFQMSAMVKHPGDQIVPSEQPALKRSRSELPINQQFQLAHQHRSAVTSAGESEAGHSPTPVDQLHTRVYQRKTSPRRGGVSLPSPSTLNLLPSSGAPTHFTSPKTSCQPVALSHTTTDEKATAVHIADLQHEVSLKSLALRTLRSEYASLLQTLQRDRAKIQAIDKKTAEADNKVNDLTARNDELLEQMQSLGAQLEDLERKRSHERSEAQKEKEQWGRMLEMSGRLQQKLENDKQKLRLEKETLLAQVAHHDKQASGRNLDGLNSRSWSTHRDDTAATHIIENGQGRPQTDDNTLKHQVDVLTSRLSALQSALQRVRLANSSILSQATSVDFLMREAVLPYPSKDPDTSASSEYRLIE